jgi:hypothetical protein
MTSGRPTGRGARPHDGGARRPWGAGGVDEIGERARFAHAAGVGGVNGGYDFNGYADGLGRVMGGVMRSDLALYLAQSAAAGEGFYRGWWGFWGWGWLWLLLIPLLVLLLRFARRGLRR